jgi:hypothetical protein
MRGLAALTAILVALAAAACGSQSASPPTLSGDVVALAATKTNDAGTYKADISGTVDAAGQSIKMSGTGAFDASQQRGTMSITASIVGQDVDMQMIYALPVMYMHFPAGLLPGLPSDKSWVKMDLEKLGQHVGLDLEQLMQAQQADPSQGLKYLEGLTEVQAVGHEEIRGVSTTHYKGVVDLKSLAAKYPELQPSIDQLVKQAGISRIPMEAWIDENNLVRQMKESFDAAGATTAMTIQLYDFGTTVDVSPPPADETIDLTQLIGQN